MKLALYCPVYGYYEGEADKVGRAGDFYTSVSVGSLFGELLAFQFAGWLDDLWKTAGKSSPGGDWKIIETGVYNGQLARDILCWIQTVRGDLWDEFSYYIVEPSPTLRSKQEKMLSEFATKVHWVSRIEDFGSELSGERSPGVRGIIFSNELLDAMPVRRIGWDAKSKSWFEWGVALEHDRFVWLKLPGTQNPIPTPEISDELGQVLPDGFTTEICTAATEWWQRAAGILTDGKLVAIDYGMSAAELILPERKDGTLRTYAKHQVNSDLLSEPGFKDITAHVNFTAIQQAGEAVGLKTDLCVSQEKFLVEIVRRTLEPGSRFGEWDAARRRQFQTLTHPEHLGRPFRVLVQSRAATGAVSS